MLEVLTQATQAKGHQEQQHGCGFNSMTALILLNIFLMFLFMFLFAVPWMSRSSQDWLNGQYGFVKHRV